MDEAILRERHNRSKQLRYIAEKELIYNRDINDHIISCKMAINQIEERDKDLEEKSKLIKEQTETIKNSKYRLVIKEEQIRQKDEEQMKTTEKHLIEINNKNQEIKQLRKIIEEQYRLIGELTNNE